MTSNSPFFKELGERVRGEDRTYRKVSESRSEGEGRGQSEGEKFDLVEGKGNQSEGQRLGRKKKKKDQIHVFFSSTIRQTE